MINVQSVVNRVYWKCQQQFSTAFLDSTDILEAVNSAKDMICLYCDWSWSLISDVVDASSTPKKFELTKNWFKYLKAFWKLYNSGQEWWIELSIVKRLPTGDTENLRLISIRWKDVTTSEIYEKVCVLYHKIEDDVTNAQSWTYDIPLPFRSPMASIALGILYTGWFEQGAELSNKNYLDMEKWLSNFKSAYQFDGSTKAFIPWF